MNWRFPLSPKTLTKMWFQFKTCTAARQYCARSNGYLAKSSMIGKRYTPEFNNEADWMAYTPTVRKAKNMDHFFE